jgi:hypothetical protein
VSLVMGSDSLAIPRDSLVILREQQTKKEGHYLWAGTRFIVSTLLCTFDLLHPSR